MADEQKPSRWRGIIKNAVVWGAGWGVLGTAVATVFRLNDNIKLPFALLDGIGMGVRIGFMGGIVGAVFAAFISIAYRGKRISEINWLRFGLGAFILAGLFVPTFIQVMRLLTGGGLAPFSDINGDMLYSALFGGITAAGTMKLAQMDEKKNPVTAEQLLDRMEQSSLGPGEASVFQPRDQARESNPVSTKRTH